MGLVRQADLLNECFSSFLMPTYVDQKLGSDKEDFQDFLCRILFYDFVKFNLNGPYLEQNIMLEKKYALLNRSYLWQYQLRLSDTLR